MKSKTHVSEEPCDDVTEDDRLVGLMIVGWSGDSRKVPEVAFPLVNLVVHAARVEQQHPGVPFDQPATVETLDTMCAHRGDRPSESVVGGGPRLCGVRRRRRRACWRFEGRERESLDLHGRRLV